MNTKHSNCLATVEHPQDYLVCVTIHKARNVSMFNMDTYVLVTLDKSTKATETAQNTDCPSFNEYFVFELTCSQKEMLRQSISIVLFAKTCCAKKDMHMGEIVIDLRTVWNMKGGFHGDDFFKQHFYFYYLFFFNSQIIRFLKNGDDSLRNIIMINAQILIHIFN